MFNSGGDPRVDELSKRGFEVSSIKRVITVFEKSDELMKDEFELVNTDLVELQMLFSIERDNPMYDCFEITENEAEYFENKFNIHFDFEKKVYYLECNLEE